MESALGVLNFGNSYLRAGHYLLAAKSSGQLRLSFDDPISFMFGHGIELTLKACLLHRTQQTPRSHDLKKLRAQAIAVGWLLNLDLTEEGHYDLLNGVFGSAPHEVRYLRTGVTLVHDDEVIGRIALRFSQEAQTTIA